MKPRQSKKLPQCFEVLGADTGTLRISRSGSLIAPPRVADDPIAGLGEGGLLVDPNSSAATGGVKQHDRSSGPTGVPEPQTRLTDGRYCLRHRDACWNCHRSHRIAKAHWYT